MLPGFWKADGPDIDCATDWHTASCAGSISDGLGKRPARLHAVRVVEG
jgi:hypothetical protein